MPTIRKETELIDIEALFEPSLKNIEHHWQFLYLTIINDIMADSLIIYIKKNKE